MFSKERTLGKVGKEGKEGRANPPMVRLVSRHATRRGLVPRVGGSGSQSTQGYGYRRCTRGRISNVAGEMSFVAVWM